MKSSSAPGSSAGERRAQTQSDIDDATDYLRQAPRGQSSCEQSPQTTRQKDINTVRDQRQTHVEQAEEHHLARNRALARIDELRQEGKEEHRDLWIEHAHNHAVDKESTKRTRRWCAYISGLVSSQNGANTQIDEITGTEGLDESECRRRREQNRRESRRRGADVHEGAHRQADDGHKAGTLPLSDDCERPCTGHRVLEISKTTRAAATNPNRSVSPGIGFPFAFHFGVFHVPVGGLLEYVPRPAENALAEGRSGELHAERHAII